MEQIITLSEQIFGISGMRAGGNVSSADIEIELGENVLPKPQGNNWNGFTWKKVTVVPVVTGIEEINVANALNVYPNPVTDLLHVECRDVARNVSTALTLAEYFIYNSVGQIVMRGQMQGEISTLNVEFLPSGMYLIRMNGQTAKFLKK